MPLPASVLEWEMFNLAPEVILNLLGRNETSNPRCSPDEITDHDNSDESSSIKFVLVLWTLT